MSPEAFPKGFHVRKTIAFALVLALLLPIAAFWGWLVLSPKPPLLDGVPFSPLVLAARVKTLLSRHGKEERTVGTFGALTIDEMRREVLVGGAPAELTPKEYELLIYFKNNKNIALSRESILNAVWGYDYFGDLRTVDTHVKKLRAKLGACGSMIATVRGYGYRFEASV